MKKSQLLLIAALITAAPSTAQPRTLVAETNHSTIGFSVPISQGITRITGKFTDFSIELEVGADATPARIAAVIKAGSINTGIPGRDEDLKSKDFFETEKYPEIVFNSDKIVKRNDGFLATGKLTFHGVTKTIDLPFAKTGQHSDDVLGFSSRYVLKRSDFNLGTEWKHTTDDHFIGDEIGVEIDFWTKKPKEKK